MNTFQEVGATAWGGQWCTSPGFAYAHESVVETFVAECKKAVIELYGTDPKNNSDYSRIISPKAVDRLASLINQSKVVSGGSSDREARYIDPTILYPVTWDDPIMEDEIFGPLLPILTYIDTETGRGAQGMAGTTYGQREIRALAEKALSGDQE